VAADGAVTIDDLGTLTGAGPAVVLLAVTGLERAGAVRLGFDGTVSAVAGHGPDGDAAAEVEAAHEAARSVERSRAEMAQRLLDSKACRWNALLAYFGEAAEGPCGHCDNCDAADGNETVDADDGARPFAVGERVTHGQWGGGEVLAYEGDVMTVLFESVGYKSLSVELVVEGELLTPAG
jgi:ATP-dependent DNA helicase RecQ